tara:strand:- start:241 stop:660 length:420 start_codon:yes stop_codon:yes gene_type:complete
MNDNFNINQFKIFGLSIEIFSVLYGSFLILWGIIVSFISGSESMTSLIPSIIGLPILIFSSLSLKFEKKKKLFMHIVVFFGLVTLVGGLDLIRLLINGSIFSNFWADLSKLMMLFTGIFFVTQCIRSFIHARKLKELNN